MKIFKRMRERNQQRTVSLVRNQIIQEIKHINIKLETLQMFLVELKENGILPINDETQSLLQELKFFASTEHKSNLEERFFSLDDDWKIKRMQASFDQQEKINSVIDELKQKIGKSRHLHVFQETTLDYSEKLQKLRYACIRKLFEIDQYTSDQAYCRYLESFDFRLDKVQEEPEAEPEEPEIQVELEDFDFSRK